MNSAAEIFLMIGLAHWSAHLLACQSCKAAIWSNVTFLLEGSLYVFGWPIHAYGYVMDMWKPKKANGPTPEEFARLLEVKFKAIMEEREKERPSIFKDVKVTVGPAAEKKENV